MRCPGGGVFLAVLSFLVSCGPGGPVPEVEYSGCWTFSQPGPVCALYPGPEPKLKLWVRADPGTAVEIEAGGRALPAVGEEVKGGRRFLLPIPPGLSPLTVRLRQPDGSRDPAWSLSLAPPEVPAWYSETREQRLLQIRKAAPRKEQGLLLRQLALIARSQGQDDRAAGYLREGIAIDHEQGLLSGEIEKQVWLARIHLDHGRFTAARQALSLQLPAQAPADAKYQVSYNQALVADRVGNYRSALDQLRKAADLAERVGMATYRWDAEQVLARFLQDLGRSKEALELFARLRNDPHPQSPCDMGNLLTNEAWTRLFAQEEQAGDPTPILLEAKLVFDQNGCLPSQRLNARLNLALAHQQAKRWPEARQALEEARPLLSGANLRERLWWLDLEGRAAIAENRPQDALGLYGELAEVAERAQSLAGRFRAAFGRARVHLALGRREEAIKDLARADHIIDEESWHVPVHEGRESFVAQREEVTRWYLQLLLDAGRLQEALALTRRARSRLLRQLAVRDRLAQLNDSDQQRWDRALSSYWELRDSVDRQAAREWQVAEDQVKSARESLASKVSEARRDLDRALADLGAPRESPLSPPKPGEVILAYHPLPRGWVGFAAHPDGIEVTKFDLPDLGDPEAQARSLLAPFLRVLDRAERVRVLPYGPLQSVDFHALSVNGEPLLARSLVVYSLDLPALSSPRPAGRHSVLLVADPEGNLPEARLEAGMVAAAIRKWGPGWTLKRLDGTDAVAKTVREELPGANLFHYAGHGTFRGLAGWDSVLPLADGSHLNLGDLLVLRPAPAWVVLSACDAGRASEQVPGEGIGLARAFLLAGSQAVVAATRPVQDRAARDLLGEMYRGWQPGADLPQQLRRVQSACLRRAPASDCAYFRLLVP